MLQRPHHSGAEADAIFERQSLRPVALFYEIANNDSKITGAMNVIESHKKPALTIWRP